MAIKKATNKKAAVKKVAPVSKTVQPVKKTAVLKQALVKKAAKETVAKKVNAKKSAPVKKAVPVKIEVVPQKSITKPLALKVKYTDPQKEVIVEMQSSGSLLILNTKTGSGLSKEPTGTANAIYKIVHTNTGKALLKLNLIKKFGKGGLVHSLTKKGSGIKF